MTTDRIEISRAAAMPRALLLLLVAVAARLITFGNPIVHVDEEFYYATAHAMARGAIPYIDIWDRKPFGLFLVYLPAGWFDPPVGIWVYQAMALAAVVGTALILARLAEDAGWRKGASAAAVLYILSLNLADGQGGQAPVFYNLAIAAAAWLTLDSSRGGDARRRWMGIGAMALAGISLQVKYSVVFEGAAFGLWLLWDEWRGRRSIAGLVGYGVVLAAVALVPTVLVAAGYGAIGHFDDFLYANFTSILARKADPIRISLENLVISLALLSPLLALAALGPGGAAEDDAARRRILFLRCWLGASLFGFLAFGSWFNHYTLPVMVPAACCAAGFLGDRPRGPRTGWILGGLLFVGGQGLLLNERHLRGTPQEFAKIVDAVGPGPGSLYIYQGSSMLYPMTGRRALTRYWFPTHLMLEREQGAVGVDQVQEIGRIFDRRPEVVVMQSPDGGEDFSKRAIVEHRLSQDGYRRKVRVPMGNKWFDIFRRP
jgi:hypothetical protein